MRIEVREQYHDWTPPKGCVVAVRRMFDSVPEKFTAGLGSVVLTNAGGLNHVDRRRKIRSAGRKVRIAEARGVYRYATRTQPAWIELFVDNIFEDAPRWMTVLVPVRELLLGGVLFHEI